MKQSLKIILKWGAAVLVILVFAGLLFPCLGCGGMASRRLQASIQMQIIDSACKAYLYDFGSYPVGTPSEIVSILMGGNPRGIIYLEVRARDRNQKGEVVDPWQTPFRFDNVSPVNPPRLSSAGPDRTFGTKDDLVLPPH